MVLQALGLQAAKHPVAVLGEASEVAIELLIPVKRTQVGQMLDLIDIAGPQAAAVGLLQRYQLPSTSPMRCRLPARPGWGSRCCQLRVR